VLSTLKKRARKRKQSVRPQSVSEEISQGTSDEASSSESVNKEWNHWVVLHGKEKEAAEDVWGIGKVIGLLFERDNHNMFSVLSRAGNGKRELNKCDASERGSSVVGGC
jgi:hypothetical protein